MNRHQPQGCGNVIGLPFGLPKLIDKKRYWRLVSDFMKLRTLQ
jgi:hypothetical protein